MRALPSVLWLQALALCWGCGGPSGRLVGDVFIRGQNERFHVEPPESPWQRLKDRGDVAWYHPPTDAVIAANASCRDARRHVPLTVLMNDLLIGTARRQILLEEETVLDGRKALHQVVAVELEGGQVVYDLYVWRNDRCVYDLSLVVPPRSYDAVADDFVEFVSGFRGLEAAS